MYLPFTNETWKFRSPSGGNGKIIDADRLQLSGLPLSYGAYDCKVPLSPGWVRLEAQCHTDGLASPDTAATVMISFLSADGKTLRRQYADTKTEKEKVFFSREFEVPPGAVKGEITLALRWPGAGSAVFSPPALISIAPPASRKAKVVVTHFCTKSGGDWPKRTKSLFEKIGALSPDLICMSEGLHLRGIDIDIRNATEPIGGAFTTLLSEQAVKYNTYVTGNFMETHEYGMYNTSILLDRSGSIAGVFRKVHLPLSEVESGIIPGSEYPVFETDFARIGMMVCWDAGFPEAARRLRLNGAQLLVSATIGDFWPVEMARAKDNGVWFAIAGEHRFEGNPPPSRIIDPQGNLVCCCGEPNTDSYIYADIDFNQRFYTPWLSVGSGEGEGPSLYLMERRPDTY